MQGISSTTPRRVTIGCVAIVAMSAVLAGGAIRSEAASICKGLAAAQCTTKQGCTWQAAMVKGEISPVSGKPYKVNRKAHCRPGAPSKPTPTAKS